MPEIARQQKSPTPSAGPQGSDVVEGARRIAGLLDNDGHANAEPTRRSRAHPDYDPSTDERNNADGSTERDSKGRFKAATPEAGKKAPAGDTDDADDAAAVAALGDDSTEDTEDGDTDEGKSQSADKAGDDAADTATIETLEQLASELGLSVEDLASQITHKFRAADQDLTVTLAELVKGYQRDADYRRSTGKLAEDRRAAEADYAARMQHFEQQNVYLANQFHFAEQALAAELNDPRLAQLRQSDPAEWTARRQEIGQRVGMLQQARQQAAANYQTFMDSQRGQLRERERQALLSKKADFSNEDRDAARQAMASIGYTDNEINEIVDHRLVLGAIELMSLRKEVAALRDKQTKAQDAIKRVTKEVPKLQKPGKTQMQAKGAAVSKSNLDKLRGRARKSGRVEDAARVIEQLI